MFSRILGRARAVSGSRIAEQYIQDDEEILNVFKVWRDELVFTTKGVYTINRKGITGVRTRVKYVTNSQIIGISYENAFFLARTCKLVINYRSVMSDRIRVIKTDVEEVKEVYRRIKENIK